MNAWGLILLIILVLAIYDEVSSKNYINKEEEETEPVYGFNCDNK